MAKAANRIPTKRIILVCGTSRAGFTFLEIIIVLFVMGLIFAIATPNLQQRSPKYKRQEFIDRLNELAFLGWQQAMQTQTAHRVFFDIEHQEARLEIEQVTGGKSQFAPVTQAYAKTKYNWPENIEIKQFFINGANEMSQGKKVLKIWFFIVPDGMAQEVIINAIDTAQQTNSGKDIEIGLVLNPFTVKFKQYESFQTP